MCLFSRNKIINRLTIFLVVAHLFSLGCSAHLNEGYVDYRVSLPRTTALPTDGIPNEPGKFQTRYLYTNPSSVNPIALNESVSIQMLQGFICDFHEGSWAEAFGFGLSKSDREESCQGGSKDTRGEIVILASAFERNASSSITYDNSAKDKGRVVYYNEDVRESGQMYNFSNLPLYGPKKYEGNPFYLQLWIMELDQEENAKAKNLLKSIAAAGTTVYPPASPALAILNSIGASLLEGPSDDIEFQYQTEFDAPGGQSNISKPPLLPGYYALVRMENRNDSPPWGELRIDRKSGKLKFCAGKEISANVNIDKECTDYRQETWLTLKIDRNKPSFDLDAGQAFLEFQSANKKITQKEADDFVANLQKLELNIKQLKVFNNVRKQFGIIESNTNFKDPKQLAARTQAIEESLTNLCEAVISADDRSKKDTLPAEQIEYFINKLDNQFTIAAGKLDSSNLLTQCRSAGGAQQLKTDLAIR